MDFLKKCLSSITLSAMAATMFVSPAQAALDFRDGNEIPSWAEEAIEELMDQGVISGNDDGSFAPNRQLNRAEVSKVIVLANGLDLNTTGGPHFPDVKEGAWYYDYIETMYNKGWINGYPDGEFRPGVGINRAEIAKMVVNAFDIDQDLAGAPHFDDVSDSDWFYGYVETAYNNGLMRGYGDGSFGPANAVTRAETVKIVYDSQLAVATPSGPASGTLEVVLSEDTPRGTNIPFNATSVPFTTVELTASDDDDVEISSLTFTRLGLGDNDDFDNVWLEIDGFKVGNDKSINNDDVVELRFNPPIVVPAGQTIVGDVVTSLKFSANDKNTGHHNRLALVAADDVVSTAANIAGDFPIEGEEMEVAEYEVSQIKFSRLGSDTNIDVGDNFIEIGKFRMLNASNTNKDVEIRALTFKNDGTAEIEDNLENVALYVSGEQVSAETIIDGDYVTFRLDNGVTGGYIIEDGDSRIFSIRADIVSAEKNDVINFKVDNFEDIVGVEIGTAFGVKAISGDSMGLDFVDKTTSTNTTACTDENAEDQCARLRAYEVDSGDLNISRDPASLGNQEYAPGSNDVVFLTARVVVDQPLIVDGLRIDVSSVENIGTDLVLNATFDNFRLFLNDKLVDSENDFTVTGTVADAYLDFNTTFEIAGTSILKVVANVQDAAVNNAKLKLEILNTSFTSPEYISTGDQVSSSEVLGSAQGSFVEVKDSVLTIARTDGLSDDDKIVAGVDDVTFLKFVLDNNDSGDVNVSSVTVKGISGGNASTFSNFTAAVFVDGTQQGSSKGLSTAGEATFNDLSVTIPSAGQKEIEVVVDTIEASADIVTAQVAADATAKASDTDGIAITDFVYYGDATTSVLATTTVATLVDQAIAANNTVANTVIVTDAIAGTFNVGDVVNVETTAPAAFVTGATITAIVNDAGVNSTMTVNKTIAIAAATSAGHQIDLVSRKAVLKHSIELQVTKVDADNVENGQQVFLGGDGNKDGVLDSALGGASFELVQSGRLSATVGTTVYSDLIVANSSDVEVMKVRLNASDDEVQVKDLYFVNDTDGNFATDEIDIGNRVSFKLYNEAGQLIQEKTMTDGVLHFELANQDRIRVPKNESATVTVKVDVKDITKANQTGKQLRLRLNTGAGNNGFEAITAATGSDIAAANISTSLVDGEVFVAYRTQVSVRHAATQPAFTDPSASSQEAYRFTVTADQARQAEIGTVTLKVAISGMMRAADTPFVAGDFTVKQVKTDGTIDDSSTVLDGTTPIVVTGVVNENLDGDVGADDAVGADVTVNFLNQKLAKGESRTYALFIANTTNTVTGAESDDDSISATILRDTVYTAPTSLDAQRTATRKLIWSDESSSSHTVSTADWINGYLVDVDTTAKVNQD